MTNEPKTIDHSIAWLEKRNAILINMILACGFGRLALDDAVQQITKIVRKHAKAA